MQGFTLAAGQVIAGHPAVGIWLGTAIMCAAIFWMLLAWLPARWALLGGVVTVFQIGGLGYWAHSYWGGAVAAAGGALALGAMRRLFREPTASSGLLLAIGLGVLANSRPFEGLLLSLCISVPLAWALWTRDGKYRRKFAVRTIPLAFLVLSLVMLGMGYYFWRATGSPVRMPYQVHDATYSFRSFAPWVGLDPVPEYRHDIIRDFYVMWGDRPTLTGDPLGFAAASVVKLGRLHLFFLGVLGLLPVLALPRVLRDPWARYATTVILILVGATLFSSAYPHYLAPVAGLILFMAMQSMRGLLHWSRGPGGKRLIEITLVLFAATVPIRVYLHLHPIRDSGFVQQREEVRRSLTALPGEHLVVVRYTDGHLFHNEWVFNRADIDASRIVWARDMGPESNRALLAYFADRTVWLLESGKPSGAKLGFKEEVVELSRCPRTAEPGPHSTALPVQ